MATAGISASDAESLIPQAEAARDAAEELLAMLRQAAEGMPVEPLKVLLAVSNAAQKALAAALAISFDAR